jgi:hypothetical protein
LGNFWGPSCDYNITIAIWYEYIRIYCKRETEAVSIWLAAYFILHISLILISGRPAVGLPYGVYLKIYIPVYDKPGKCRYELLQ